MNSPLVKEYHNESQMNLVDSLRIRAGYKPQVTGVSTNSYAPVMGGWGYDYAITNGYNFGQLISVSKTIVSKENLHNQFNALHIQNLSLNVSGKITEQDLKKTITAQYITAYGTWQQLNFNKELLDLLKKEETILKTLTSNGVYRQTDYLTFLVILQQQELQISQLHLQLQNEYATLNYLSGLNDTSFSSLAKPSLEVAALPDIENTVFYQQFKLDSLKLKNNDAQIDFSYKPKLNLYANGGYLSSFAYKSYKNFGTSFGVDITVPIYDGRQKKMQHDKIAIQEQTRQNYQQYFAKQYDQQIAQLFQQLESTQQIIDLTASQLKYSERLMEVNKKLLETGDVKIADYIIAIGNYLNIKNTITENTINKLQIINQINYWNLK